MDNTERLKILRKAFSLTQKELAERIGYTKQFVSQIEAGTSNAGVKFQRRVIEVFNLPKDFWDSEISIQEGTFTRANHQVGELVLTPSAVNTLKTFISELDACRGEVNTKPVNPEYYELTDMGKLTIDNIIHALLMQERGLKND